MFDRKALTRLILPLIAEEILTGLIAIVDILMIAHLGEVAVSGLSLIDSINLLVLSIFMALANGSAIVVAQFLGAGEGERAGSAARQAAWLMLLFSLAVGLFCFLGNRWILEGLYGSVEGAVLDAAQRYFTLISLSYPLIAVYKITSALFRAMGNTRISMATSFLMNLANIALNALFIYGFSLGVLGAALGTFLSRGLGAGAVVLLLFRSREPVTYQGLGRTRFSAPIVGRILGISVPTCVESSVFHVGKILVQQVVASFGTSAIAANAVALTITEFTHMPAAAIGVAMITVVGQCVGAREYRQAKRYMFRLLGVAYGFTVIISVLSVVLAPQIIAMFRQEAETAAIAVQILILHGILCAITWPLAFTLPRGLQAASDVKYTMVVSVAVMWIFRVGGSYLLAAAVPQWGVIVVWVAMFTDWVARVVLYLGRAASGGWRKATEGKGLTEESG